LRVAHNVPERNSRGKKDEFPSGMEMKKIKFENLDL